MGARQSTRAPSRPVSGQWEVAQLKKRESRWLQKSRAKYLSKILTESEADLSSLAVQPDQSDQTQDGSPQRLLPTDQGDTGSGGQESAPSTTDGDVRFLPLSRGDGEGEPETGTDEALQLADGHRSPGQRAVQEEEVNPILMAALEESPKGKVGAIKKGRVSFQPMGRYDRSSSFHDEVDHRAARVRPQDYDFDFENLVLEGGGNKGLSYCGAVRCLEELGMMSNIRRLAGASAGGMVAGLLAVEYTSYEIEDFLSDRIDRVFLDASCGVCSLLPNLLRNFGWNPGRRIYDWFGDKLKAKTGDADVTFHQVYQKFGKMLCIVVTNLNQMSTEYCHPKTTPNMPVRLALRMSMAIPGLFSAMRYGQFETEDIYVDGGVLCNYPIHCFDGWFLSMAPEDSFIRRLQPLRDIPLIMERNNRFGTFNDKTLGMLLYSDAEEDILRIHLERRVGCLLPAKPTKETKLFKEREKVAKMKLRAEREHAKVVQAVDSFLRVLKKHNIDHNDVIDRSELESAFKDETEFPRHQAEVLFGKDFTVNEAFDLLDRDDNGQIRYDELVRFIEGNGVSLQSRFLGYQRKEIKNFRSFLGMLQSTLIFNVKKLYVEERDLDRTVGINTGHVHTTDFVLEDADREFAVQRGYNSMMTFLRYYIVRHPHKVTSKDAVDDATA